MNNKESQKQFEIVDSAIKESTLIAIEDAKKYGTPLAVWENGKLKHISAEEAEGLYFKNQS